MPAQRRRGIAGLAGKYYHDDMELVSFKLPPALRRRIAAEARRRGISQGAVIRESIESALVDRRAGRRALTCADLAADLIGAVRNGPPDLSTNRRYLDEAIAADHVAGAGSGGRGKKRRR